MRWLTRCNSINLVNSKATQIIGKNIIWLKTIQDNIFLKKKFWDDNILDKLISIRVNFSNSRLES